MTKPSRSVAALTALVALAAVVAGIAPGASGGYQAKITNSSNTAASAPYFTCAASIASDKATAVFQLPLTEAAGATSASDVSGNANTGTYQGPMSTAAGPSACSRDGGTAYVLNGNSSFLTTTPKITNPNTFTLEVWFKTSTPTGKLIGFGNSQTGSSSSYDRQLYITSGGLLTFGTYNSGTKTITTTSTVTDGTWHQAIATFAPAGTSNPGMTLYLDGKQAAVNTSYTTAESNTGWWRIGWDNQSGWPSIGSSAYFNGALRYVSVYTSAFTPTQVGNHYAAGR